MTEQWVAEQLRSAPPVTPERAATISRIIANGLQEQQEQSQG